MKKLLLSCISIFVFSTCTFAQKTMTVVEKKLIDSLCNSVNRLDMSKITTKDEAIQAYTNCINMHLDILQEFATERNMDISNVDQMKSLGIDIAKDLAVQKCEPFLKLAGLIAQKSVAQAGNIVTGIFKRIDTKGFNYIVISEGGNEQSFLWFKQFPGSEKLITNPSSYIGKRLKILYQDVEAYVPQAKGYYKVKEITAIDIQ